MKPVIGIVICGFRDDLQFVSHPYVQAVEHTGAVPVLLPFIRDCSCFPAYYSLCDGFLFCGGGDISPSLFGEDLLTNRGSTDETTDRFHLELMKYVLDTSLPILGICRGMQVLNVALGGTIYQDISLREGPSQNHMQISKKRSDICHRVAFSYNSILYNICGSYTGTNSFHHQCVKTPGKGLRIAGIAADGVIEALEGTASGFRVGVQWHPECMYASCPAMSELFWAFADHARHAKTISIPI